MALPNTNISVAMVKAELSASTNDVGQLCIHPNVNMWSKWKPIRHSSIEPITQAQLEAHNYGIAWNSYANIDAVKLAYENRDDVLNYNKPRGGLYNEPYRLTDFINYEKTAIIPIAGALVTQQAQNIENGQTTITGSVFINGLPKVGEIGWEDLNFAGRKLAMALYSGGDLIKTAVANNSGDMYVDMDTRYPLPVLSAGIYNAYLFFTNAAGTTSGSLRGIPNHLRFGYPVGVVSNLVLISIEAHWSESNPNQIIYTVKGTNQTGASISLLNCSIRIRNWSNECTSTMQQGEILLNLGTLTLPNTGAGIPATVYTDNVTVTREQYPSWKMCWNNGGAYPFTTETNIIQEM
jgi:hypothetical protein